MSIRQEILKNIKSRELSEIGCPKKISAYFGENTFSIPTIPSPVISEIISPFSSPGIISSPGGSSGGGS